MTMRQLLERLGGEGVNQCQTEQDCAYQLYRLQSASFDHFSWVHGTAKAKKPCQTTV
jgi:hypothetical protein